MEANETSCEACAERGGMVLRTEIRAEDVGVLCALAAGTGFFSEEEILIVEELGLAALHHGEESGYSFLIAHPEGGERDRPVGFACYGPVPCTKGSWDLYWIVVDGRLRGRGYGSRLLAEVERRVRERDGRKLFAETSSREQYAPTRGFYSGSGYSLASRLVDYYDRGEDCVVYAKELD